MPNVVEIIVRSVNQTSAGMAAAERDAKAGGERAARAWTTAYSTVSKVGAAAFVGVGVASTMMAAKFQEGLTTLVTGAGEAESNLKLVGDGIKKIAVDTGTSTNQLIEGMYMIESAGFHGAAGLKVLQAAAEGAKVGNADLGTVSNAVTTVLNDYKLSADQAVPATNALVAIVASGKVHMEDLAASISRVLPTAAALHISMGEVGGALATMTGEGVSAKLASMGLNAALLALASPSGVAQKQMAALGLSSKTVSDTLTHQGLIAALTMVTDAAGNKFPPGSAQYVAAVNAMMGGNRGLQVALDLTGTHLDTLKKNTDTVGKAMGSTSKDVSGWDKVQKEFNVKLDQFKEKLEVAGINLGTKLMPAIEAMVTFVSKNANVFGPLLLGLAGLMATAKVVEAIRAITGAIWAMDAALAANPIGIIVLALAALGTAFYIAWKKSADFRDTVKNIGIDALTVGIVIAKAAKGITDVWLTMVGSMIHGAALAFGWIPGIGPKLKEADKNFQDFKKGVDNSFNGMIGAMENWKHQLNDSVNQQGRASSIIVDDFAKQQVAAINAKKDLNDYSQAIINNGIYSSAAWKARTQLYTDMLNAGVSAKVAQKDIDAYSSAVINNGINSNAAKAARQQLSKDIYSVWVNSQQGQKDVNNLTSAIINQGKNSDAAKSARNRLIQDLINAGVDATTAKTLVNNLQGAINNMHGKNVPVGVTASGSGGIHFFEQGVINKTFQLEHMAAEGWRVPGYGGGDKHIIAVEGGETVVPKELTPSIAPMMKKYGVPGFQRGGLVPRNFGSMVPASADALSYAAQVTSEMALRATYDLAKQQTEALVRQILAAQQTGFMGDSGARSASAAVAQAFAKSLLWQYHWGMDQWAPLVYLWNQESGWNAYAVNPQSGAYGIPQSLGHGHVYNLGDYQNQIIWGLNYIRERFGSPSAAWAHEQAYNWYDGGGWLPPGKSIAVNRTGRYERVLAPGEGGGFTIIIQNHGVIGSRIETENWLAKSLDSLRRQGRLPRV